MLQNQGCVYQGVVHVKAVWNAGSLRMFKKDALFAPEVDASATEQAMKGAALRMLHFELVKHLIWCPSPKMAASAMPSLNCNVHHPFLFCSCCNCMCDSHLL